MTSIVAVGSRLVVLRTVRLVVNPEVLEVPIAEVGEEDNELAKDDAEGRGIETLEVTVIDADLREVEEKVVD